MTDNQEERPETALEAFDRAIADVPTEEIRAIVDLNRPRARGLPLHAQLILTLLLAELRRRERKGRATTKGNRERAQSKMGFTGLRALR